MRALRCGQRGHNGTRAARGRVPRHPAGSVPSRAAPSRAEGGRCGRACGRSPFCGAAPRCRPRPAEPGRAPPLSAAPSRAGLSHAGAAAMYGEFPLEPGRAGAVRAPPGLPGTWGSPSPPPLRGWAVWPQGPIRVGGISALSRALHSVYCGLFPFWRL